MKRINRRLVIPGWSLLFLALFSAPQARAAEGLPPERTFSNTPFLHRILLRDEEGNLISPPRPGPDGKIADDGAKAMSQYATCGKCHSDKDTMYGGWHSNASDPGAPKGRPGEPWIWTDVQTRTQLPMSYRKWPGTWRPNEVGINDFQFALNFGHHLPGGDAAFKSNDLRFKMSGKFELDCLICHVSDNQYDLNDRAAQLGADSQNFKWAATSAAMLGKVQGDAAKFKDNWDPNDPNARPAPKIVYRTERFDGKSMVVLNVSRRVSNDRCYFCHTNISAGPVGGEPAAPEPTPKPATEPATKPASESPAKPAAPHGGLAERQNLERRWNHDRDIHIVKGLLCVDCHRNGADHLITRGYEGEYQDRVKAYGAEKVDPTITTLSCQGCHLGTQFAAGGRNAAPRPMHKGFPLLHFDKLSCTTCHSGPMPDDATEMVQTALAHRLGIPHHRHSDEAGPVIQQPVFLRVDSSGKQVAEDEPGKITPHKLIYPAFWGRLNGNVITPISPDGVRAAVKASATKLFGAPPDPKEVEEFKPLTNDQVLDALGKIAENLAVTSLMAVKTTDVTPAVLVSPTTQPSAQSSPGEAVYVTGGKAYKRSADGKVLEAFDNDAAKPYAWALAHDVRGAQQALGARGCTDCHASGAPIFDGQVSTASILVDAKASRPMHELRGDSTAALAAFAATYPMRPILITVGFASAILLGLTLLTYATKAISRVGSRKH